MADISKLIESGKDNENKKLSMLDEVLARLSGLSDDTSDIQKIIKDIQELGRETLKLYDSILGDFQKLKESNAEIEEKLAQMSKKLDELREAMPEGDYNVNKTLCEQKYSGIWLKLDEASKTFLVTSSYLCKKCAGESLDFSPMIVEMSRAYENELLEKIFRDFIVQNASSAMLTPSGNKDALYKAVSDVRNGKPFFVSLTQMVKIMNRMPTNADKTYGHKLNNELNSTWDTGKLSDNGFFNNGMTYATDYRNRAAHPGTTLSQTDANDCEQLSQTLLSHFINSMKA